MEAKPKIDVNAIIKQFERNRLKLRSISPDDIKAMSKERLKQFGEDLDALEAFARKVRASFED